MDLSDLLYRNHNIAVMLAVRFAAQLGLEVGVGEDPLELGWPVLYIMLPTGEQVAWRVPPEELVGDWPAFTAHHDGHTPEERSARLRKYLETPQPGLAPQSHTAPQSAPQPIPIAEPAPPPAPPLPSAPRNKLFPKLG
ncbi:MAG: hypothetical protein IT323_21690 [Anaerolineae bacterium]|nr:hypothetical protein [Anaerolineae bacterium]